MTSRELSLVIKNLSLAVRWIGTMCCIGICDCRTKDALVTRHKTTHPCPLSLRKKLLYFLVQFQVDVKSEILLYRCFQAIIYASYTYEYIIKKQGYALWNCCCCEFQYDVQAFNILLLKSVTESTVLL
jgi:hypothetical protein